MFPHGSNRQATWTHDMPRISSGRRRSRGPESTRSPRDRGWFVVRLKPLSTPSDGPWLPCDRGHQPAPTTASNGPNFWAKILFKTDVFSPLFFNFWLIRKSIKRIWSKILSSSWSPRIETQLWRNWRGIDREFLFDFIEFSPWIPNVREEEIEQIHFNPLELKPHYCGNRVNSGTWSIIKW